MSKITMKVAIYEYLLTGDMSSIAGYRFVSSDRGNSDANALRISEFKDVEFEELEKNQELSAVIKSIDKKIDEISKEYNHKIAALQKQKEGLKK